jgi:hypothetical protein
LGGLCGSGYPIKFLVRLKKIKNNTCNLYCNRLW